MPSPQIQFCLLLLEKSLYTDEAYLFALVALLLSCTDCGKTLGLDAPKVEEGSVPGGGGGGGGGRAAALRDQPADTVPHWHLVLIRFQVNRARYFHCHKGKVAAIGLFTWYWFAAMLVTHGLFLFVTSLRSPVVVCTFVATCQVLAFVLYSAASEVPKAEGVHVMFMPTLENAHVMIFLLAVSGCT